MAHKVKRPRDAFREHRASAKQRGIPFLISYEQWLELWLESGHWHERGPRKGQYCMARPGDVGPYAKTNVMIITHAENIRQANSARTYVPHTEATRASISRSLTGQKRPTVSVANRNRVWSPASRSKLATAKKASWAAKRSV